jgi:dienelactone hydrolase
MRARLLVAAILAWAAPAWGQAPPERIEFASRTPTGPSDYLAGGGAAVTLYGFLYRPARAAGLVPAMVVAHGSGGILPGRERDWAARLVAAGVAALVVDSFGPRGIGGTAEDQSRLPLAASVADHFAALGALASVPGIDPARIGIMGFSKGGQIALYTALEPFRRAGGVGDRRFVLHVALYPSCSLPYMAERTTGAPLLFLLGGADDYTPAAHCDRYAEYFRAKGSAVSLHTLPGAHHGFDLPAPPRFLPRVQTARNCALDILLEPVRGRRWDGQDVPNEAIGIYIRGCVTRGATVGGNPAALKSAIALVEQAVAAELRPAPAR